MPVYFPHYLHVSHYQEPVNPFQAMELEFAELFKGTGIMEIEGPEMPLPPEEHDIEMDEYRVIRLNPGELGMLATTGVAACIAVGARGLDSDGRIYLGLYHACLHPIEDVFETLFDEMEEQGCDKRTIQTFAVGGLKAFKLGNDDNSSQGTSKYEKQLLELGSSYGLTGVCLHVNAAEDDGVDVWITPDKVLYARRRVDNFL